MEYSFALSSKLTEFLGVGLWYFWEKFKIFNTGGRKYSYATDSPHPHPMWTVKFTLPPSPPPPTPFILAFTQQFTSSSVHTHPNQKI